MQRKAALGAIAGALAFSSQALRSTASAQTAPVVPPLETKLRPEQSAIIMVDFQNSFASPGGEHYRDFQAMFAQTGFIDKAVATVKQARRLGIQVIEVMEAYTPDYRELDPVNGGSFHRSQIVRKSWKTGTPEVQLLDALQPGPGDKDMLYPNRTTANAFGSNGLDLMLRSRGIRNIAVGGFATEVCVYATVLAGYDLGYRMYTLTDATAHIDPQFGESVMLKMMPRWSRLMTSPQYLAMFA